MANLVIQNLNLKISTKTIAKPTILHYYLNDDHDYS